MQVGHAGMHAHGMPMQALASWARQCGRHRAAQPDFLFPRCCPLVSPQVRQQCPVCRKKRRSVFKVFL